MVPLAHPSSQPKWHLDRFSRFAGLTSVTDRQTDRPTDHATRSVTIGRIYVRIVRAMRHKKLSVDFHKSQEPVDCRPEKSLLNSGSDPGHIVDLFRIYR